MSRKYKIGMIVNLLPDKKNRGGVAYQVYTFAQMLAQEFEITVFTRNQTNLSHNFKNTTVKIPRFLSSIRFCSILLFPLLVRFQGLGKFDIVHAHGDDYLFFFVRKPIIRTFYGTALGEMRTATSIKRKAHQFFRYFTEYMSGFHARINVGISHSTKKYLPFINRIIPCGIDLGKFKPGNEKSKNPSILFVGTIKGRKRGWLLVEIFNKIIKPKIPNAELWIVSSEEVEGEGIRWFGRIPNERLIELNQKAWVFCLPSKYEGFGVPYIEAMACGTTVVASPNSGAKEVLCNGKYGFIVGDKLLGKVLINLLKSRRLRDKYTQEGLERVKEFNWSNIIEKYIKLYSVILEKVQQR
ncbi:glycosyltransferase family 4 protein [candidate division WOR-3 bacterium]|nr:glycosyltransferase family 4 protein [candidate division WOR-3 bacterium]